MKDTILIVDDVEINRIILSEILSSDYNVVEAADGIEAVDILYNTDEKIEAVLLDIMMPGLNGFQVLEKMKEHYKTEKIPVLFITAADSDANETKGLKEGAVDYISKPFHPEVVKARVDNHIQLKKYQNNLEELVEAKASELLETHERILETLATIIEYRSLESGEHIRRTCELTKIIVNKMLEKEKFKNALLARDYSKMIRATSLHDIGKVGIPDSILLKPGRLTDDEFEIIKTHAIIGADIIESMDSSGDDTYLKHAREICRYHHERWDGKGYPQGLKGEEIPLSARIMNIVDVYDAIINKRCYKPSFSHEETVKIILEGKGTQFDPNIIDVFLEVQDEFIALENSMRDPM